MKYDILIPVSPKDYDILPYCLGTLHLMTPAPDRVFIVSPEREHVSKIVTDSAVPTEIITDEELFDFAGKGRKPGWFQQIIKMFQQVTGDNYLVWDADLVIKKPFPVFSPDGIPFMRYYLNPGHTNVNDEYNAFMLDAFGQAPSIHMTMVCHHMFFRRDIIRSMMDDFLARHPKPDDRSDAQWFYDWLLEKGVGYEGHVSEYEAYAHYALEKFPLGYELKRASMQDAVTFQAVRNPALIEMILRQATDVFVAIHRRDHSFTGKW